MAVELTIESFLNVVRKSGLIGGEELEDLIGVMQKKGIDLNRTSLVANELVTAGALTDWQAGKLLQGKHQGFLLTKYRLLDFLGKGGMSAVYLAEHLVLKRRCAIKVMFPRLIGDPSYLARFQREAQAVAILDHPNIVRVHDIDCQLEGEIEIHFLVMEYVDGNDLQNLVVRAGALAHQEAANYICQSARGLAHAHQAGLVHRDIKPSNLIVNREGIVKILDLGLARFFNDKNRQSLILSSDRRVLGTVDYLAPEQAMNSHQVDARADIYSLGCTFYFLLSGHPPFDKGSLAQRITDHRLTPPPPLRDCCPDLPPPLATVIDKMMAKDPADRYQLANEIADLLKAWLEKG